MRLTFHLLGAPDDLAQDIAAALVALKQGIRECEVCCNLVAESPCPLCRDPRREGSMVCVVEHPQDILAIERGGAFQGHFHVLHGAISPLDGVGPDDLRVAQLVKRVSGGGVQEVLLATDPDLEGDTTAIYLSRLLRPLGVRVTRLAHGLAVGTEVEYADRLSLARAIENRREMD